MHILAAYANQQQQLMLECMVIVACNCCPLVSAAVDDDYAWPCALHQFMFIVATGHCWLLQMLSSTGHMMSGVDAYTLPAVHDLAAFSAEGDMQGVTSQQHQQQQDMMMMQSIAATQGVTAMDTGS